MGAPDVGGGVGAAYLFYGDADLAGDLTPDATLTGAGILDNVGVAMVGLGDTNGDGLDDFALGSNNRRTWLFHGATVPVQSGDAADQANVTFLGVPSQQAGLTVARAGDLNGDGHDDLLIGAPGDDEVARNAGAVFVVYGGQDWTQFTVDGAVELESYEHYGYLTDPSDHDSLVSAAQAGVYEGAKLVGSAFSDGAGAALAGAGDVNGDGHPDLLIGAPDHDHDGVTNTGNAFVVFGGSYGVDVNADGVPPLFMDNDRDGFGAESSSISGCEMHSPLAADGAPLYVSNDGQLPDCDDTNEAIYPYAPETSMDGVDSNCDGKDEQNIPPVTTSCVVSPTAPVSTDTLLATPRPTDSRSSSRPASTPKPSTSPLASG